MADTININTKPKETSGIAANDDVFISKSGSALRRADIAAIGDYIIQNVASNINGSSNTIAAAINSFWNVIRPIYRGSIEAGASYSVSGMGAHVIYVIAYGNWNSSQLIIAFPKQTDPPSTKLVAKYSGDSMSDISFTSGSSSWGFTVNNTSSEIKHPLTIFAIYKAN